ncbi:hypothetical protein BGZ63DRAFT_426806 [Mariannaea sp. PMI_226]|nr:hypothetical protein BGZ63DRAFT_426806 [Mariannaea sp. PMI_226]
MASPAENHVYATLLLSDSYLPGALVLAHSLRDAGTQHKLAVLVTLDSVSAESVAQLRTVYDYIFPVPRIRNGTPANLYLMNRPDLHSAMTKINLWKLTEFTKIVYIDADIVAYRAPDELFNVPHPFAAAPDIGWPDLFNTGVMVLQPDMGEYYAMMAMAERGVSFDGADQGLINMHFGNRYHRLSFTYNVTPSAHYQYIPAYRHFQSNINLVHFIGSEKPWFTGRDAPHGSGPFDEMVGRWWAVYDRHYRVKESNQDNKKPPVSELIQYFTKGEFHPRPAHEQPGTGEHQSLGHHDPVLAESFHPPPPSHDQPGYQHRHDIEHVHHVFEHGHHEYREPLEEHHDSQVQHHEPSHEPHHGGGEETKGGTSGPVSAPFASHSVSHGAPVSTTSGTQAEARPEQQVSDHHDHPTRYHEEARPAEDKPEPAPIPMHNWDAQRQPPPADSKPEAINFPATHYEMSKDTAPFVPPARYPSPPRNMWYEVPKEPPAPASQPPPEIFPWERHRPPPLRSFVEQSPEQPEQPDQSTQPPEPLAHELSEHLAEELSVLGSVTTDTKSEPSTPTTLTTLKTAPVDPWSSFPRVNAWDEVPEIERYVEGLQGHRRQKSHRRIGGLKVGDQSGLRGGGLKLTDFPTEIERPSLPVTPAPVRRGPYWSGYPDGGEGEDARRLPEAEGVPTQSEWDPTERLLQLARQQSETLLEKLGGSQVQYSDSGREIPSRPLPFGSDDALRSHTYVTQTVLGGVLSPQPVKGEVTTSILRNMGSEHFEADLATKSSISEPSYSGPGAAWERGEAIPLRETPLLPTEEERDVLDT